VTKIAWIEKKKKKLIMDGLKKTVQKYKFSDGFFQTVSKFKAGLFQTV
jgi:hypothetical protein